MAQTATLQIQMPEMGESVTEGIVLEWHVAEGDFVKEGDTVVEVSTDKVDAEVPAPADGVITKLIAQVNDEVPVGSPLAEMEPGAEQGGDHPMPGREAEDMPGIDETKPAAGADRNLTPSGTAAGRADHAESPLEGDGDGVRATPVARRVAAEHGVDLAGVSGSGPGEKVTKEDVLAATDGDGAAPAAVVNCAHSCRSSRPSRRIGLRLRSGS